MPCAAPDRGTAICGTSSVLGAAISSGRLLFGDIAQHVGVNVEADVGDVVEVPARRERHDLADGAFTHQFLRAIAVRRAARAKFAPCRPQCDRQQCKVYRK